MIKYIQFRGDVSVGVGLRSIASISAYDASKHVKLIQPTIEGGEVRLHMLDEEGKRNGTVKRVPMSSVAYIDEANEVKKP